MNRNKACGGRGLMIAVGITALVLLMVGGAGATKFINDNATGGDCTAIGTWNVASKTCTLTTDLRNETIEIDTDSITLDGNGHTITGNYTTAWGHGNYTLYGINLSGRSDVTIKNMNVSIFFHGISVYYSNNNTLSGNNASNNYAGIYLLYSNNNTLSGNNANLNNALGMEIIGGISLVSRQ